MGDIRNVKKLYSQAEWDAREDYYADELGKLVIPASPDTKDVLKLTSHIDSLLSEAMLDYAYIKRQSEDYDTKMKLAEKQLFSDVKNKTAAKLTEAEVKSLVVDYLYKNPIFNMPLDIYTAVSIYSKRNIFIETVVKMLSEKKSALISDNAMLKIEANM